jgi:hypothetical protein
MGYLSGPVNSLTDFQVEYAGLLMGPGTPYGLPPTWTFLDSAPARTTDTARAWGDGSWSGPDFADTATWQLPIEISPIPGIPFAAAVMQLRAVLAISQASRPLWVKIPGMALQGIRAKCTQRSIPIDHGFELGTLAVGAVQWRAPNPVWQSMPRANTLSPATNAAGLGFPLFTAYTGTGAVLDYGVTAAAPYAAVLTNSGNTAAAPVAVVSGPTAGFQLAVDGHIVAYSDTLSGTDQVTVDWATGRAYLSAAGSSPVDRTYLLTARDFTGLVPPSGSATVTYAGTGGTAVVTSADLWR